MLNEFMTEKLLGMLIRHGMTVIGGFLIAEGYADEQTVQSLTGGAVALGGVALSYAEKRTRE